MSNQLPRPLSSTIVEISVFTTINDAGARMTKAFQVGYIRGQPDPAVFLEDVVDEMVNTLAALQPMANAPSQVPRCPACGKVMKAYAGVTALDGQPILNLCTCIL